jgi:hypothetical protein
VLQDLKTGAVVVQETPDPVPARGRLLVRVQASMLSAGTESAQLAKARQSLLARIRDKPRLIRKGLEELRERGLAGPQEKLASKFEGYAELGYSCAGTVLHCGDEPVGIAPGSQVARAGAGVANHAELVSVPALLTAAAVPEGVSSEAAAYTTLGAIAMQGVRQVAVQLGEYVAVIGLGLVGLLAVQLLRAAGCRVAGIDPSSNAQRRGRSNGCEVAAGPEQALEAVMSLSGGVGADATCCRRRTSPAPCASPTARSGRCSTPRRARRGWPRSNSSASPANRCGAIDDYRDAEYFERDRREQFGRRRQDKGQAALLDGFIRCLRDGKEPPMRVEDIMESSILTLAAQQSLGARQSVDVRTLRHLVV